MIRFFLVVTLAVAGWMAAPVASAAEEDEITLESLLREMTDRDALARFPDPAYTCRQFSSYDRRSKEPGNPDWFANLDNRQYLGTEERDGRAVHLLMDAKGPGAIVRFWSTAEGPGYGNGILRIHLDGADEPAIEGEVFDILSGQILARAPLSESVPQTADIRERGHNLYLPLPYAESCRVTFEPAEDRPFFYQICYRTYESGTRVRTFTMEDLKAAAPLLRETERILSSGGRDLPAEVTSQILTNRLAPGTSVCVGLDGPGAVRELSMKLAADDLEQALRSTVLEIAFDGERTVWCPAGDFFGTGHQVHPFRSWYTEVTGDGEMACRWVMPFDRSVAFTLHNLGGQEVGVRFTRKTAHGWEWDERSMHFHSTWRELHRKETVPGRGEDINFVTAGGKGVFVGDTLAVFNGTEGWGWWGEGDEKIYFDGESFPSHFGTGTEDYYGYAWAREERFDSAFHAQPCGDGNKFGGFSVNSRYRALDAIPFTRSFRFDMELWHHRRTGINYAPTAFWYARPGAVCPIEPDPEGAARTVAKKREDVWKVFRVDGALEGEALRIVETTGGVTEIQQGFPPKWSMEKQVWWRDGKRGDRLVLEFNAGRAGRMRVHAGLTRARDYGIVMISVNGRPAPQPFDRYSEVLECDEVALGVFDLKEGINLLEVEIAGANPESIARHMFGLDYLRIEEVR